MTRTIILLTSTLLLISPLALAQDHEGHEHKGPRYGGTTANAGAYRFEVVFTRGGLQLHVFDRKHVPLDPKLARGTVTVTYEARGQKPSRSRLQYVPPRERSPGLPGHLKAKVDLTRVPDGEAKVKLELTKLPGAISFTVEFNLSPRVVYACPMGDVEPLAAPGECPRCGMNLVRKQVIYECPMHPRVASRNKMDRCWLCSMRLAERKRPPARSKHSHGR